MKEQLMKDKKQIIRIIDEVGKIPPQAIELEEGILGCLMTRDSFKIVQPILKEEMFYREHHQIIYSVIHNLGMTDKPIDMLIIHEELKKKNQNDIIGDSTELARLCNLACQTHHLEYYAKIILQKYIQRLVIQECIIFKNKCYDDEDDIDDILIQLEAKIRHLSNGFLTTKKRISANTISENFFSQIEDETNKIKTWLTGWPRFDDKIGIRKDKIILVGGAAKAGKSRFIDALMFSLLSKYNDISVFWITLEDSARDVLANYIGSKIFIKSKYIKEQQRIADKKQDIAIAIETFGKWDIEFIDKSIKVSQIRNDFFDFCKIRKDRLNILIVDNVLQLADRDDYKNDLNGMYDYVMSQMLNIRQDTNALIFVVHHFKDAQQDPNRLIEAYRPRLIDLKGTEAFRRIPNQVLLINNPGKYKDLVVEYEDYKEVFKYLFIVDISANREDTSDDDTALIRFLCTLNYNIFMEITNP